MKVHVVDTSRHSKLNAKYQLTTVTLSSVFTCTVQTMIHLHL